MERIAGDWLIRSDTRAVMHALSAQGATPRFVGGCVRDALLRRPVRDIDIAIDVPPEETASLLNAAGIKAIPTGIAHGTITAVVDGKPFEVTTLRRDVSTDGRHANVEFTTDWKADARRRDFTMNALYADTNGAVYDVLGTGLADLNASKVKFIGDPVARIEEDYLRILRYFRFEAWYGKGDMDGRALVACANLAGRMVSLSRERVGGEMLKMLGAPDPCAAYAMMAQTGALARALPNARADADLRALIAAEPRAKRAPDGLLRLAYITRGTDPTVIARALKLSNAQMKFLEVRGASTPEISETAAARRLGYEAGVDAATDLLIFNAADRGEMVAPALLIAVREGAEFSLPISSHDVMAVGVPPGPILGEALSAAEQRWIESDFALDSNSLMDTVRKTARIALMREAEMRSQSSAHQAR